MTETFLTRPATTDDAVAVCRLVNSAYRGDSSRAGWTTEADLLGGQRIDEDRIREDVSTDGHVILVHEHAGEIVACVHLERTDEGCYLGMLTTRPTLQGSGIGRRMMDAAEHWAATQWRLTEMHMSVISVRHELIAYYERRGYRRTGERRAFPYGDERFGLPQRPDLEFVVLRKSLSADTR